MSLTRNFFNEFRPFFRLFDEVSRAHPSHSLLSRRHFDGHFDDFGFPRSHRPSVDLAEQGNEYVVQAEVPGVKKEDLEVRVGDQGRSVTIEGRIHARSPSVTSSSAASDKSDAPAAQDSSKEVVQAPSAASTQISSEREFVGSSHFTRTVWLPRSVDSSKVSGSLEDGILTLRIPKAVEQGSVKVDIQ